MIRMLNQAGRVLAEAARHESTKPRQPQPYVCSRSSEPARETAVTGPVGPACRAGICQQAAPGRATVLSWIMCQSSKQESRELIGQTQTKKREADCGEARMLPG